MDSEFRSWWIGKNGAQQWSKALDDEGGALGAIEMIFKAGAATQQARIEALEKAARGVVEARGIGFMQVHKEDVPEFMHLMNRIDKLAALLEQEGGE